MGLSNCITKARDAIKKSAKKQRNQAMRSGSPDTSEQFSETQEKALVGLIARIGDVQALDGDNQAAADAIRSAIEDLMLDREALAIQVERAGLEMPAAPDVAVDQKTVKNETPSAATVSAENPSQNQDSIKKADQPGAETVTAPADAEASKSFEYMLKNKNMATYHELVTDAQKGEYRDGYIAGYNGDSFPEAAIKSRAMDEGYQLGARIGKQDRSSRGEDEAGNAVDVQSTVSQPKADAALEASQDNDPAITRLTSAQASDQMEWRNLGQRDGTKTQALFFYETAEDMAAHRGSMQYGEVTQYDGGKWQFDGVSYDSLGAAKKAAEQAAVVRLVKDGYVENPFAKYDAEAKSYGYEVKPDGLIHLNGEPTGVAIIEKSGRLRVQSSSGTLLGTYPAEADAIGRFLKSFWYAEKKDIPEPAQASDSRDAFTVERLNRETDQMQPTQFNRGQYVKALLHGAGADARWVFGEIEGISQAKREAKVDGLWYPFGSIYEAERPAVAAPETVPMSEVIDSVNAANSEGITEADRIATVESHSEFTDRLNDGNVTIDEFKARFESVKKSKDALIAELGKKTKPELLAILGGYRADRMKNDKKDRIVDSVYTSMLDDFVLGDSISYSFGSKYEDVIGGYVARYGQADIDAYAERIKASRAEREQRAEKIAAAVKDPQDFAEYQVYIKAKLAEGMTLQQTRMSLPAEKRATFDNEMAEASRNARGERKEVAKTQVQAAAQTTAGQLFESKHTKTGEPLFVVKTADRVDRDIYNQWNATAKRLGGYYSSYRGNGAIPGFTFKTKEGAEAFMQYLGGDTVAAQEAIKTDRDAFADDRSQSAVERLNEMADRLDANADSVLSADRKTNTERRARFAASAEAAANSNKAMAQTMRNIAKSISEGTAKFLDMVRQKAQVEMLRSKLQTAKQDEAKAQDPNGWYTKELHKKPATVETADFATWPTYTAYRSDIAQMGRALLQLDGGKRLGQSVLKVADDVTNAYKAFAKENLYKVSTFKTSDGGPAVFSTADKAEEAIARSGFKGKATTISFKRGEHLVIMGPQMARENGIWQGDDDQRITLAPDFAEQIVAFNKSLNKRTQDIRMPWVFDNVAQERARWKAMGIETPAEMRAALREFVSLNEQAKEVDKIKQMERAMIGRRNDGLDFFPTSQDVVQQMLESAEIEPGMSVLEPSAGMGHIADQIRAAGVDPDVIELSGDRRDLLEAKGFNVIGSDFTEIQARDFFTYGDVFKAPDGTVGVMRGSGGLGSNRVGLQPLDAEGNPDARRSMWVDRDSLVGVEKRGSMSGYDRIIMNPPFSNRRDAEHVQHAYTLLRPGGRIVAIMGEGVFFGQDKKAVEFREWLESVGGTSEKLPEGSFLDPSLPVNTAANARLVVIDKQDNNGATLHQSGVQHYYDQYQQRAAAFNDLPASQRDAESRYGFSLEGANGEPGGLSGVDGNEGAGSTTGRGRYAVLGNGVAKDFVGSGNARLGDVQNVSERAVLRQPDSNVAGRSGFDENSGRMEDGSGEAGRGRYSSVADGVAEDFKATGRTKLVGLKISSPDDLATAAQIYRDPRLETARYFFTKNGEVIGQTAISSRKPGVTKIFPGKTEQDFVSHINDISEQMRSLGADGVWMLHNHPSGDPRPSGADIASTIRVRNEFNRRGLVFNGHVIINSQRYGFIDPNGKQRVVIKDFGDAAMYDINKPKVAHPLIGGNASTPGHLALIAKLSQKSSGNVVVIGLSGGFTTRVISEVSPDQLRGKFGAAILRRIAKQTGSDRLFAYGVSPSDIGAVREAIKTGLLVDGIVVDNGVETSVAGLPDTEGPMDGYSLGTQDTGFVVEQGSSALPETITIDGVERPTMNSNGNPIHPTEAGVRNFWRWFGDSKVVDENGQPLVVYHGTVARSGPRTPDMGDIKAFDRLYTTRFRGASIDTLGSWFSTNPGQGGAEMYSGRSEGSAVYPVYLSIKNPQVTTFQLIQRRARLLANGKDDGRRIGEAEVDAYRKWLKEMGKDGVKIEASGNEGSTEFDNQVAWIALEPEQIKSATGNVGDFDATNPDIRYNAADGGGFVSEFLSELAAEDAAFRYPVSKSKTLEGNIADAMPGAEYLGEDTRPDEKAESMADRRFAFKTPGDKTFYVFTRGDDEVWIDVSRLEPGDQGSAVYHGVANYAYNTGKVFIGDPNGLSEDAIIRRTSAMLSSALRFGTTRHIAAADEQMAGAKKNGIPPLSWKDGDDVANLKALIDTYLSTLQSKYPGIKNARYDFGTGQFIGANDLPIRRGDGPGSFDAAAASGPGRASRAGEASLRRGILIQSLASSESSERPGLLELVLSRSSQLVGEQGGLGRVFSQATGGKTSTTDQAIYAMAEEGRSVGEILDYIAASSSSPFNRALAGLLKTAGVKTKITVGGSSGWALNSGEGGKFSAGYNPASDTAALFRSQAAERNILHELVHAATLTALERNGLASSKMKALFAHVKRSGKLDGTYGMTSIDEFAAEVFTNPKFQELLKTIEAAPINGKKARSAWDWFVGIVRGILGMEAGQDNALSQALEIGIAVMEENAAMRDGEVAFTEITGKEIDAMPGNTLQSKATNWLRQNLQGKTVVNDSTGWEISTGRKGINKAMSHSGTESVARSVAAIPDLLKNAVLVQTEQNNNASERDDVPWAHHFYAPVRIGGADYVASIVVKEAKDGTRFYDYDTSNEISPADPDSTLPFSQRRGAEPGARTAMSMSELLSYVKEEHGGKDSRFTPGKTLGKVRGMADEDTVSGTSIRRGTAEEAQANGFTMRAYRGVSAASPFNDSGTVWLTTSRSAAESYATEVFGYEDPEVIEVWVKPDQIPVWDMRKVSDEELETLNPDEFGNPQNIGIYRNSDDSMLGGSGAGTVIHAPVDSIFVIDDEAAGRIRYNVADDGWSVAEPSKMDDFIYTLQDKQIDLKRVIDAIKATGKKIADQFNPYLQEELFYGRSAKGVKDFLDFELRPLLKEMQARNVDMGDFEEYLWNRHAEERNIQIAKINKDMPDGGSGISTEDARSYLAGLDPERRATLEELAEKIDAINKANQRVLVESGLETQETIDAWNGAYKHYVPLQREDVDTGHVGTGKGYSIRGSSSKRAMGSGRQVVDIIANLTMQRERNIVRAEKNRVSNALMGLALQNPNDDFWQVDTAPKERTVQEKAIYYVVDSNGERTGEEFTRIDDADRAAKAIGGSIEQTFEDRVVERVVPGFQSRDNVILTRVNGQDHYIIFNERNERALRMAMSLKNMDTDTMGRALSVVGMATRYLASVNTQYNPVFGVINLVRDVQGALINLQSTPLAGQQKRVFGYAISALRGIYSDLRAHRRGEKPSSQWADLFEEFQKEGAQTGYRDQFANSEARAEEIQSEFKQFQEGKPIKFGRAIFQWLSDYNETMENAVRLAAYKVAKEDGMSTQQAASLAKTLTVNFNRKGSATTQIGALYAFFNASVQGTARIAETLFEKNNGDFKKIRLSKLGKKVVAGGILLGVMQALLLEAAGYDDDEPPEFVRERSLVFPIGNGKYLSLPMPLGFHAIPGIGRIATEFILSGGKDPAKRVTDMLGMFVEAFNPVGSSGISIQSLTPSVIDPLAALAENRDFTGREIYRENFNANDPSPGHARAKDVATPWARFISEGVNWATGGTEFKPGAFSPSPDAIDYLVAQVTGGVGREVNKVFQTAGATMTGDDLPLYKVPLVGRFVGDTEGLSGNSQKFYNAVREINLHEREVKGLREAGRNAEAHQYVAENPAYRLAKLANATETQVRKLRDQRRKASESGDSAKVREINDRISAILVRFNERAAPLLE